MKFFPRLSRNDDAVSEPLDDGSVDGDSVASESSSDASKSPEEGDKITIPPPLDFSQPWVDVYILEFVDPSLFMVRTQDTAMNSGTNPDTILQLYYDLIFFVPKSSDAGIIIGSLRKPRQQRQRKRLQTKDLMRNTMAVYVRHNSWNICLSSSVKRQREMIKFCVVRRT